MTESPYFFLSLCVYVCVCVCVDGATPSRCHNCPRVGMIEWPQQQRKMQRVSSVSLLNRCSEFVSQGSVPVMDCLLFVCAGRRQPSTMFDLRQRHRRSQGHITSTAGNAPTEFGLVDGKCRDRERPRQRGSFQKVRGIRVHSTDVQKYFGGRRNAVRPGNRRQEQPERTPTPAADRLPRLDRKAADRRATLRRSGGY